MKICTKCKQPKPLTEFYKKRNALSASCKDCFHIYQQQRWNRRKALFIKELGGKCMDCGKVVHPAAFDFHHRNPLEKEFTITEIKDRSIDFIRKELVKCDLLCANCHRLKHINPKSWDFDLDNPEFQENIPIFNTCICGKKKNQTMKFCSPKCSQKNKEIIKWPNNLPELVKNSSKRAVAKLLGVSDKAVAKRLKNHFKIQ